MTNSSACATQVRAELSHWFDGCRFVVRAGTATMSNAVTVRWNNGPPVDAVRAILMKFHEGYFQDERDGLAVVKFIDMNRQVTTNSRIETWTVSMA